MNETMVNLGMLAEAKACSGKGILKNPAEIPQQMVLTASVAALAATTSVDFTDSCLLSKSLGSTEGANSAKLVASGGITADNIREFLKTHALVIGGFNFESSKAALLSNNLNIIYSSLDGNDRKVQLFSAKSVSNMQNNPNLLNVRQSFVLTNTAAMRIAIASDAIDTVTYTFTFDIIAAIPYGKLDEFLEYNKIPSNLAIGC